MKIWVRNRSKRNALTVIFLGFVMVMIYFWIHRDPMEITVAVFEEHHEALPYWFEAAEDGLIPRQGNILVHIDGHSDESTPEYIPGIPFFKWPETDEQMGLLLQKNDIFIQAAVMAGLISRVIWIFPSWDPTIEDTYTKQEVFLGWMKVQEGNVISPYFCECHFDYDDPSDLECVIVNTTLPVKESEQAINPELCHLERKYISEHVHEDVAVNMMAEKDWIPDDLNVILDIDEDYFGCESGAKPLTSAGIKWKVIEQLNEALESFMCPLFPSQEDMGDDILRNIIVFYQKICSWEEEAQGRCVTSIKHLFFATQEKIVHFWRKHPSLFCARNDLVLRNTWKDVLRVLFTLTRSQLQALLKVGFCFRTSQVSLGFAQDSGELQVCHGVNVPNDTVVYLHTASEEETLQRSVKLNKMMASDSLANIKLVTICRSVRDGFTPREQSAHIEKLLLDSLSESHPEHKFDTQYDVNLLGGEQGWSSRSKHSVY